MSISSTSQPSALARLQRLVGEARGIGAGLLGDHRHAGAIAPHLELLDRGGAEGVARRQHHLAALALVEVGELGDGRGLAAAVDADHQHDMRLARRIDGERRRHRLQDLGDVVGEGRAHLLVGHFLAEALLAELLDQARGDADAEIGLDQRVLQLVERLPGRASSW